MDCLTRLCAGCADTFGLCVRCYRKREREKLDATRKNRLTELDKRGGINNMTKEERQRMANMIYTETQRMLLAITGELVHMPLDSFLARIDRSEAIAPLLNPEIYLKGRKQMQAVRDIGRALNTVVAELERVVMDAPDSMEETDVWPNLQALKTFVRAKRQAKEDRNATKPEAEGEARGAGSEAGTIGPANG
jgi:hypothetical protein